MNFTDKHTYTQRDTHTNTDTHPLRLSETSDERVQKRTEKNDNNYINVYEGRIDK